MPNMASNPYPKSKKWFNLPENNQTNNYPKHFRLNLIHLISIPYWSKDFSIFSHVLYMVHNYGDSMHSWPLLLLLQNHNVKRKIQHRKILSQLFLNAIHYLDNLFYSSLKHLIIERSKWKCVILGISHIFRGSSHNRSIFIYLPVY